MSQFKTKIIHIKELLKKQPRGLTISEISQVIGSSRNSTAKYLDLMHISGEIELRAVGRAKLYYPTQRIPLSALLDYSSDHIIVLNEDQEIIQINSNLLNILRLGKEELIGTHISNSPTLSNNQAVMYQYISQILGNNKKDILNLQNRYFRTKQLKTTFNDGSQGITLIFNEITDEKKFKDTLIKLHQYSRALVECKSNDELFDLTRDAMISILGFDRVDIWLIEKEHLVQVTVNEELPKGFSIPLSGKGIIVKVIKEKSTILVEDVANDPDYMYAYEASENINPYTFIPSKSELASPIIYDGEAIGVLNVESVKTTPFTENDIALIEILAIHVSNALRKLNQQNPHK